MNEEKLRLGVIGCGGFGLFALQHFTQVPGVELVGMAGTHREAALAAARRFGIPDPIEVEDLVKRDDVDLIYIATPPFLHYSQAMMALEAGKHVICEKPLAMNLDEADEMIAAARKRDLLLIANLMQRYNPELMELFLPVLRADIELGEDYLLAAPDTLDCPLSAYGGLQDAEASPADVEQWGKYGGSDVRMRRFPGHHFFLHSYRDMVLAAIAEDLASAMDREEEASRGGH